MLLPNAITETRLSPREPQRARIKPRTCETFFIGVWCVLSAARY
jgi:hypothetical protein